MAAFALDSNCMIAAVCGWHEDHAAAVAAIGERRSRGGATIVPAHALAEAYSVLTRLPPPHRLAPGDAWRLIEANFVSGCRVAHATGAAYVRVLRRCAALDLGGGRVYDAVIAECARDSHAIELLTFNPRHFDPLPPGLIIVTP